MNEQEIWERAYFAAIAGADIVDDDTPVEVVSWAKGVANEALKVHKERWPSSGGSDYAEKPVVIIGAGSISGVLAGAVAELQAANRYDAHKVLSSLYEAYKAGQASTWTPPPRG